MAAIDGGLAGEFREHIRDFHWQRVETGGTGRGIPDTNACFGGCEFWIEFKQTEGWAITLSPEQIGWHLRRNRAGGRTWIAVRQRAAAGPRRTRRDGLWLLAGNHAALANTGGLRAAEGLERVYHWPGPGAAKWAWDEIRAILLR